MARRRSTRCPRVRSDSYRIVDQRFSPSGSRIAPRCSVRPAARAPVYVAPGRGPWHHERRGRDRRRLLGQDGCSSRRRRVISAVRASGLTAPPAHRPEGASPVIGRRKRTSSPGRVQVRGASEKFGFSAAANVWSIRGRTDVVARSPHQIRKLAARRRGPGDTSSPRHEPAQLVIAHPELLPRAPGSSSG